MAKRIAILLGVLLVITNAVWLYALVDQSVTLSYREQVLYEQDKRLSALANMTNALIKGKDKKEITALLSEADPEQPPYEKDGALNSLWLSVAIGGNGKATRVITDGVLPNWAESSAPKSRQNNASMGSEK